ncbi:MAG TPA: glycoside hydrolase family 3 C-terminal domain-containing protein [Verrucomicrobiae bacterium]|nr:glycoside hydrolase family 3 C-terminal domain-containing protein [Verrucomicrobiae bacterium]
MRVAQVLLLGTCATLGACGNSAPSVADANAPAGASRCGDHPWCDTSLTPDQRAALLLAELTLQEKFDLMAGDDPFGVLTGNPATGTVNGVPRVELPPQYMSDGPVGPREGSATAFPSPMALASTFSPAMAFRVGQTIANEVRNKANDLIHAPTVDVMRIPQAGRTFETYGEDPFLSSRLAPEWIRGVQSEGVIGNVKHYAGNHQEGQVGVPPITSVVGGRQSINAMIDDRTLRELYLPPFESAVLEGDVGTVMCAYNIVNSQPACASTQLIEEILRGDWGFTGMVISDYYFALKDTQQSALHGVDVEMPTPQFYMPSQLEAAVNSGDVPESRIDEHVMAILRTLFRFGFFDRAAFPSDEGLIAREAHAQVARENLEQGIVLLQNDGILPLDDATRSIAVIGAVAETYVNGGGSSAVVPYEFKAPRQSIAVRAGPGVQVKYNDGSDAESAAALAATTDVAIVFVRDTASEGTDKNCLSLDCGQFPGAPSPGTQDNLIRSVVAENPRTIVVMETSGPVLTPWRGEIAALLEAWYPGQEAGPAIARVLYGDVDASGRLPASFMVAENHTPVAGNPMQYPGVGNTAQYTEGLLTGYRWHDENDVAPAYPFGHGLSYTRFAFSDLAVSASEVTATVKNIGARAGVAVPQLYIGMPEPSPAVPQPPRQLKGFTRITLAPGESATVSFPLNARSLSYWDVIGGDWAIAPGCYAISVGASSRDLPLRGRLPVGGGSC